MDQAAALRALHRPGSPLVLPNAWDAASARAVVDARFAAVATSSGGVALAIGSLDHEHMTADEAFAAVARIAAAVGGDVPVTADIEAGYGLAPDELVERLLAAGAVGCNVEDTDHARGDSDRGLVDPDAHATRLAAIRAAAGDRLVINARVDTFLLRRPDARAEAIERGRRYLDAGADCVYPITIADEADIAAVVEALGVVNVLLWPGVPPLARLADLGAARVSVGGGLFRLADAHVRALVTALAAGDDAAFRAPRG